MGTGSKIMPFDLTADYHVYAVEWEPLNEFRFFVDDTCIWRVNLSRSFNIGGVGPYTAPGQPWDQKFHLIINLAIGGGFFKGYGKRKSTIAIVQMTIFCCVSNTFSGWLTHQEADQWEHPILSVDYVRVYEMTPDTTPDTNPPPTENTDTENTETTSETTNTQEPTNTPTDSTATDGTSLPPFSN
jgi:hypothetical protein